MTNNPMKTTINNLTIGYETIFPARKSRPSELSEDGTVMIFVHGWGGNRKSLWNLAQGADEKNRKILIDLPGFGESATPPKNWGVDEYASFLGDFINHLQISKPIVLVGHSFGGAIAIKFSSTHSSQISSLVLIAPSFLRDKSENFYQKYFKKNIPKSILRFVKNTGLAKKIVYKAFFPGSDLTRYPQLQENLKKIVTQNLSDDAKKISSKTLILWGSDDEQTPVAHANILAQLIKKSTLEIFPLAGHDIPLKQYSELSKRIDSFINS
jgi:pimeloyl-ACP methyl ester carboxylesterase